MAYGGDETSQHNNMFCIRVDLTLEGSELIALIRKFMNKSIVNLRDERNVPCSIFPLTVFIVIFKSVSAHNQDFSAFVFTDTNALS